jgi:hypothetical protein
MGIQDGCLMINGRLPKVAQVRDPSYLGVHPAPPEQGADLDHLTAESRIPAYVPRDTDERLRELLAEGGFVLLIGGATAGKSRTAYEAMTATLPQHTLKAPHDRDALPSSLAKAAETSQCVVGLDDLESYLGPSALTCNKIAGLTSGGQHRVILATLRAVEEVRYTSDTAGPEAARHAHRDAREVLEIAIACGFLASSARQSRSAPRPESGTPALLMLSPALATTA